MQALETFLKRLAGRANARWWAGPRPEGRDGQMGRIVAGQIGYPAAADDPFADGGLTRLSRAEAARVLAVAGATSLAYGQPVPGKGWVADAAEALGALRDDAIFLSNGTWEPGDSRGWRPMTAATFDCGVIGFDADTAFIFWVEEED